MKTRRTPMTSDSILDGIRRVKSFARDDLEAIHLAIPDFEKVQLKPAKYDVIEQPDGRLVTAFKGRLIDVLPHELR